MEISESQTSPTRWKLRREPWVCRAAANPRPIFPGMNSAFLPREKNSAARARISGAAENKSKERWPEAGFEGPHSRRESGFLIPDVPTKFLRSRLERIAMPLTALRSSAPAGHCSSRRKGRRDAPPWRFRTVRICSRMRHASGWRPCACAGASSTSYVLELPYQLVFLIFSWSSAPHTSGVFPVSWASESVSLAASVLNRDKAP
jgi:hypothetical protein